MSGSLLQKTLLVGLLLTVPQPSWGAPPPLDNKTENRPETPVRVFLLAGQSNMQGQGVVEMDHPEHYNHGKGNLVWSLAHGASRERMQHLRHPDGSWAVRDDVLIADLSDDSPRRGHLTVGYTGYGGKSHIGPELQFGHVLGDHFAEPVLLLKTAWGGKSLQKDFRPPRSGGDPGPFYLEMIGRARQELDRLGKEDRPFTLSGFVWMQGWNDMISTEATEEYAANLIHLVADLRTALDQPELPVVIGELGNDGPAPADSPMSVFRQAQRQGAAKIDHCRFVPTQAFARPKEKSPNTGHGHHWYGNAESYFLIGDALGRAMVDLLEKREPNS